jgi:hypothetical protein
VREHQPAPDHHQKGALKMANQTVPVQDPEVRSNIVSIDSFSQWSCSGIGTLSKCAQRLLLAGDATSVKMAYELMDEIHYKATELENFINCVAENMGANSERDCDDPVFQIYAKYSDKRVQ